MKNVYLVHVAIELGESGGPEIAFTQIESAQAYIEERKADIIKSTKHTMDDWKQHEQYDEWWLFGEDITIYIMLLELREN